MAPIFAIIRYALLETFFCIPILPKTFPLYLKIKSINFRWSMMIAYYKAYSIDIFAIAYLL